MNLTVKRILRNSTHVLLMLHCYWFTFSAALYDKSNGANIHNTYAMLYGLVLLPVILYNILLGIFLKSKQYSTLCFSDIVELLASAIMLAIVICLGNQNDWKFAFPWLIIFMIRLAIIGYRRYHGIK